MKVFEELERISKFKSLKPWLKQKGIGYVFYRKDITVNIRKLNEIKAKSVYLPTFSNGRKVEIIHIDSIYSYWWDYR